MATIELIRDIAIMIVTVAGIVGLTVMVVDDLRFNRGIMKIIREIEKEMDKEADDHGRDL